MVESAAARLEGVLGTFLVLTWVFTGLRVYVRGFVSKGWGADDSLLIAALVCFTIYCSFAFAGIPLGIGRHPDDIPLKDIAQGMMFWWLFQIFFTLTSVLLRCSIALFILRLCQKSAYKFIIYAATGIVVIFSIFYLCLLIFQCRPISLFWDQWAATQSNVGPGGVCLNVDILKFASYAQCAISALADWVLGILPLWLIRGLQMKFRTKLSVGLLLSFGMVAGVIAITRVPFILQLPHGRGFFYGAVDMAICSIIELGLGIVATAACVLRPLIKRFSSSTSYENYRTGDTTTHHPTWRNDRSSSIDRINDTQSNDIRMNNIDIDSAVTSMYVGHRRERATEWKTKPGPVKMAQVGNESEEELTSDLNGISEHNIMEFRSQKWGGGKKGEMV